MLRYQYIILKITFKKNMSTTRNMANNIEYNNKEKIWCKTNYALYQRITSLYWISDEKAIKILKSFEWHYADISQRVSSLFTKKAETISRNFDNNKSESRNRSILSELIDQTFLTVIFDEIKNDLGLRNIEIQNTYDYIDYTRWIDYRIIFTTEQNKKIVFWLDLKNELTDNVEENSLWYMWEYDSLLYTKNWNLVTDDKTIAENINLKRAKQSVKFNKYEFNINWNTQEEITRIILENFDDRETTDEKLKKSRIIQKEYIKLKKHFSEIIKVEINWNIEEYIEESKLKVLDIIEPNNKKKKKKYNKDNAIREHINEQFRVEVEIRKKANKVKSKIKTKNTSKKEIFNLIKLIPLLINKELKINDFIERIKEWTKAQRASKGKKINEMIESLDWNQIKFKHWRSSTIRLLKDNELIIIRNFIKEYKK